MHAYVNIGANQEFRLSEAVLVYRGGGDGAFASLHHVKHGENGIPYLAPGQALTTAFVRTLTRGLGAHIQAEVFPDTVLARTPDLLVWWSRPRRRVMFFGGMDEQARKLNGLVFPHPALVFKVMGRDLFVRAAPAQGPKRPSRPLPTGIRMALAGWFVPAACACRRLPMWRRCCIGRIHTFGANSLMRRLERG